MATIGKYNRDGVLVLQQLAKLSWREADIDE